MKKHLLVFLLLAPTLASAQTAPPFAVKGQIGHLNAPAKIYLVYGPQVLDSATLQNGHFEVRGTDGWPHSAELVLERQGRLREGMRNGMYTRSSPERISLFLSSELVTVASPDSLPKARLVGGPQLAASQRLAAALQPVVKKMELAGKRKAPAAEQDALSKEYAQTAMTFIRANPSAWASLEMLNQLTMSVPPQYATVGPLYEAFSPELKNSMPGRFYGEMLQGLKRTAIGTQAPGFVQPTPDGKPIALSDYRGKYVLIDFWASWCVPCRQENPALVKAYTTYKGRNFEILGVSLDDEKSRAKWLKAIADDHLPWTQVADLHGSDNEAAQSYGIHSIPENFLLDPTGKIVASGLHGAELEATLARLIKP
jgi:peroxiredoxin